ncbi:MAG: hypothetical protein PHS38_13390 [Bacteroidales bacterium]|nr:hypothetical protein [Bacteroidales bacterium]MDD3945688.1 hypothetical protein [Bacteroidales bacterium]
MLVAACNNRNIVKISLTDTAGNVLQMECDNAAGTAVLYFMGDTIFLKQDTMAGTCHVDKGQPGSL